MDQEREPVINAGENAAVMFDDCFDASFNDMNFMNSIKKCGDSEVMYFIST